MNSEYVGSIKVAGIDYSVYKCDSVQGNPELAGLHVSMTSEIYILDSLSDQKQAQTFTHELMHAIVEAAGFDDQDEGAVNRTALVLHQVLRDNYDNPLLFPEFQNLVDECSKAVDTADRLRHQVEGFERALKERDDRITTGTAENKRLLKELQSEQSERRRLDNVCAGWEQSFLDRTKEVRDLEDAAHKLEQDVDGLTISRDAWKESQERVLKQRDHESERYAEIKDSYDIVVKQRQECRDLLDNAITERDELREKMIATETVSGERLHAMEQAMAELDHVLQDREIRQQAIESLKEDLEAATRACESWEGENKALREDQQADALAYDELDRRYKTMVAAYKKQEQINVEDAEFDGIAIADTVKLDITSEQADIALVHDLQQKEQRIKDMQAAYDRQQEVTNELAEQNGTLKADLESLRYRKSEREKWLEQENTKLGRVYETEKDRTQAQKKQIMAANKVMTDNEHELTNLRQYVERLEKDLQTEQRETDHLQQHCKRTQKSLRKHRRNAAHWYDECIKVQDKYDDLLGKLRAYIPELQTTVAPVQVESGHSDDDMSDAFKKAVMSGSGSKIAGMDSQELATAVRDVKDAFDEAKKQLGAAFLQPIVPKLTLDDLKAELFDVDEDKLKKELRRLERQKQPTMWTKNRIAAINEQLSKR